MQKYSVAVYLAGEADAEFARLRAQLPAEMEDCTIQFLECEKGHGWLTATNWIQHGCPTCERDLLKAALRWCLENGALLMNGVLYTEMLDDSPKADIAAVIAEAVEQKTGEQS